MTKILLVQPEFPVPSKRKIPHDTIPIGLLKIGTYLRDAKMDRVEFVRGKVSVNFYPDEIWITSLFTYWSDYVKEVSKYYRELYPNSKIIIGGIYASLHPEDAKETTGADFVHVGLHKEAEEWCQKYGVDYSFLGYDPDFQILHGMRGCFRKCKFCGTWKIEPVESFDNDVAKRVKKNHIIFYDNNLLRNPNIKDILRELSLVRINGKKVVYESQSGFDGRILDLEIAGLLKKAGFINPRIAWDNSINDAEDIKRQIDLLKKVGYSSKNIYLFMLYNWEYDYNTMEMKRKMCWDWKVQISDCRFRPLNQMFDKYNSRKHQSQKDYYIHPKWTDEEIKLFRSNVRKHNICVRHDFPFYSSTLERKKVSREEYSYLQKLGNEILVKKYPDIWYPNIQHKYINKLKIEDFN